jgi:uncharacterized protein YajQ (UPF0234 family)
MVVNDLDEAATAKVVEMIRAAGGKAVANIEGCEIKVGLKSRS